MINSDECHIQNFVAFAKVHIGFIGKEMPSNNISQNYIYPKIMKEVLSNLESQYSITTQFLLKSHTIPRHLCTSADLDELICDAIVKYWMTAQLRIPGKTIQDPKRFVQYQQTALETYLKFKQEYEREFNFQITDELMRRIAYCKFKANGKHVIIDFP